MFSEPQPFIIRNGGNIQYGKSRIATCRILQETPCCYPRRRYFQVFWKAPYQRELQNLFSKNVLARLWAKDASLWPAESVKAQGNFESLGRQQRPVIRLHLVRGAEQGLVQLETILNNALGKSRIAEP